MHANRHILLPLIAALAILPATARAETKQQKPGTATAPAQAKVRSGRPIPTATPAQNAPSAKPAANPAGTAAMATATPKLLPSNSQPTLLGQYDNWGAYWAAPEGRKVCFAAARPSAGQTNRGRTPAYLFITSRPHDKVKDEVSAIVSFPLKANADAFALVGGKNYLMSTRADGVWIKNQTDETKLIEAMRKGGDLVLKATTDRGLQSTDTFSLKGLAQALDRIARECK